MACQENLVGPSRNSLRLGRAFLIKVPKCLIRGLAKRVLRFGFDSPCRSSERISSGRPHLWPIKTLRRHFGALTNFLN